MKRNQRSIYTNKHACERSPSKCAISHSGKIEFTYRNRENVQFSETTRILKAPAKYPGTYTFQEFMIRWVTKIFLPDLYISYQMVFERKIIITVFHISFWNFVAKFFTFCFKKTNKIIIKNINARTVYNCVSLRRINTSFI